MRASTREILTGGGVSAGFASDMELHARISVLEQQVIEQKEATKIALQAADKNTANAFAVAEKAVAKVELAATASALEQATNSLKEAFGQQIAHSKELTAQALASAHMAVQKAEVANEKRFESVNEFRATLSDQQNQLATKTECALRFDAQEARINNLVEEFREWKGHHVGGREAIIERRSESADTRGLIFPSIMAVVAIAAVFVAALSFLEK